MSNPGKSRKPLIVGIVAAVVILAVLLVLLLTNCNGAQNTEPTQTSETTAFVAENADLYWNVDRLQYDGMSEGGMSSRRAGSDGYFHIRFFKDGQMVELRTAQKGLVNKIDTQDLMGLVFDDDGIIIGVIGVEQMPVEKVGWKFYVQSIGGNIIKVNSSDKFNGLEVLLEKGPNTKVYDMTGTTGAVGAEAEAALNDRVMAVADLEGNLLAVYIYDRSNMVVEFQAYCQHCDQEVTWIEWDNEKQLPKEDGHFQLVADVKLNAQQSIQADAKICLDLNGHTVDGKEGARMYSMHNQNCELAIMDTSEEQTGKLAGHGEVYAQGVCVWVRYGALYLYGGTLDASDVVCTGRGGAAVYVPAERFFYMHGGQIVGGTAKYYLNEDTGGYVNGMGGSVYVLGKFVLNDGVIRDGVAQAATVYKKGKATYQRGIGGNIYLANGAVFEMNGGTVKNGKAGAAGNVFLDGTAEFTMNGGIISGGAAVNPGRQGGNLNVGPKATFVFNGGSITYGSSYGTSGNVYNAGKICMNGGLISAGHVLDLETHKAKENHASSNLYISTGGKLEMYGGTIRGSAYAIDGDDKDNKRTSLVLSGLATIYGGGEDCPNLTLANSKEPVRVLVGVMHDRAKVGITGAGIFTQPTKEANLDNFVSDLKGAEILYVDECLAIGKLACLCGSKNDTHMGKCEGEELLWSPWTVSNGLPGDSGNYYLLKDIAYTRSKALGTSKNFWDINLDLNGHSIVSQQRAFSLFGTMSLVDHAGGGQIIGGGMETGKDHTGVLLVYLDSKLDIYGGTLKLADAHYNIINAGVLAIGEGGTVTMYAGTVDGRSKEAANKVGDGGAFRVHGTLHILGGTVYGGDATRGGAFFVEKTGKVNISAGTIYGANAEQGGVAYVTGKDAAMTLSGGTLEGGSSTKDGGAIRLLGNATVNITGGTVRSGSAAASGGNIGMASGVLNISGGQLLDGKATATGGNISSTGGTVNISGGTVSGGQAKGSADNHSANVMVRDAALHLSGGTIAGGVLVQNASKEIKTTLTLSGEPVVTRPGTYGLRLFGNAAAEPDLTIQGILGEKASIEIDATDVFTTKTVAENEDKFIPADELDVIHFGDDQCLFVGRVHCLCETGKESWCDHKDTRWSKWDGKTALTEGNYYLTNDVTLNFTPSIGEKGKTVNICLNGRTVTAKSRAMVVFGNVSIFDHGEAKGTIVGAGKEGDHSAVAVVRDGGVLNLYKGTYKLAENHNNLTTGGVLSVTAGGALNIYGGTVDASASLKSGKTIDSGAAIRISGTLKMVGGSVLGGKAGNGGTIAVLKGGAAQITGGVLSGGSANRGGTIFIENGAQLTVGKITVPAGTATENGGTMYVGGGTVNLNGTTVCGGSALNGGAVRIQGNGVFNMDGGVIENGTATGNGGNISLYTGTFHMQNGTVRNGTAGNSGGNFAVASTVVPPSDAKPEDTNKGDATTDKNNNNNTTTVVTPVTLNITGGAVSGGKANGAKGVGGNIHMGKTNAVVNLSKATVSGGSTSYRGGNLGGIGTVNITGSAITDGSAKGGGGNIESSNSAGLQITMANATVTGGLHNGAADTDRSNIYMTTGTLDISGDTTVGGGILLVNGPVCTISGNPQISGTGIRLSGYNAPAPTLTLGELKDTAKVVIDHEGVFAVEAESADAANFVPANEAFTVHYDKADNTLFMGYVHCLCESGQASWCDHKLVRWNKWDGKTNLTEGNYYLAEDVTVTSTPSIGEKGKTVNICLNGKTITSKNRAMIVFGNVSIFDHSQGKGTILGTGKDGDHSAVAVVRDGGVLNLYKGVLKLAENHNNLTNGGTVSVTAGGVMNIYGGVVDASASVNTENAINKGAAIRVTGTLNVYDGTVTGGKAAAGAAIYVDGGTVAISGGVVNGGDSSEGGTICADGGMVTVSGGTVNGGEAYEGGTIYADGGVVNVCGGTVNGGTAQNGGTVVLKEAAMTVSGGTVNGGTATGQGGIVHITGAKAALTVSGGDLVGGKASDGGAIRQLGSSTVKISAGSVTGGTSTGVGGNISMASGLLEISGGAVTGGVAATTGGNINVTGGTLHISGGTVSGGSARGTADNHSANIMLRNTALKLSGGKVEGSVLVQNTTPESLTSVTLSGEPVVTRPGTYGLRLLANGGDEPDVTIEGALGEKASIEIDATDVFSQKTVVENADKFTPADDLDVIHFGEDECLFVGRVHCMCQTGTADWCDHKQLRWSKWDGKTNLTEGNYYLAATDAKISGQLYIGEEGKTLNICLNGNTLTGHSGGRVMNVYGTVNIFDHSEGNGTILGVGKDGDHSAVAAVQKNAVLNLYGGTLKLAENHSDLTNLGGAVSVLGGGELNLYGGCIDASASMTSTGTVGGGGAVRVSGTMNLLGGEIVGGKVTENGGAILVKKGAVLNITKGTVSGGEASGQGNGIYTEENATVTVSGGTLSGVTMDNGNVLQLSGDPSIGALELCNGSKVQILSALTGAADSIALVDVEGLFADGATATDEEKFTTGNTELVIRMVGTSELAVGRMRCLCGTGTESWCGEHQKTFWRPFEKDQTLVSGNYYLTESVLLDSAYVLDDLTVNLDLMGNHITSESRVFLLSSATQLNILDSKGGAVVTGKGDFVKNAGGVFHINGAKLNIYSGTYQLAAEHNAISEGGVMVIGGNTSEVNIYGGTLNGQTTNGTVDQGGIIRIGGGSLAISGGSLVGNKTTTNGGGIYIKGGSVSLSGSAVIEGGEATGKGGNIYLDAGSLEISGSVIIRNGKAEQGGNIATVKAPVTIGGGSITGGSANRQNNANLYVNNAVLTLSGGTIGGGVSVINNATTAVACVKLSGDPVIKDGVQNLRLARVDAAKAYPALTVTGALTCADGSIGLTEMGEGVYADSTYAANAAKFFDDSGMYASIFWQDTLRLARVRCFCGAAEQANTAYDSVTHKSWCISSMGMANWLPLGSETNLDSGNYYLSGEMTNQPNRAINGKHVVLDLEGNTLSSTGRTFNMSNNGSLTVLDSTGTGGALVGKGNTEKNAAGVISINGSTLNLYSGTLKLATDHNPISEGGVIVAGGNDAVVNIYGGTVGAASSNTVDNGGAIRIGGGKLNISGGVINGNANVTNGGAIWIKGGAVDISGGTVNGSTVSGNGGAIYHSAGSLTVRGGTIQGGDVYTLDTALTVTGGSVSKITLVNSKDSVAADLQLSGAPTIGAVNPVGVDGKPVPTITIAGELTGNAGTIGITAGQGVFATGAKESDAQKFASTNADLAVTYYNDQLHLTGVSCLCGAATGASTAYNSVTHTQWCEASGQGMLSWLPWDGTTSVIEGNYYLTGDNTYSLEKVMDVAAGTTLNLCLNGNTLNVNSQNGAHRLINAYGTVNITDWQATPGSIVGAGKEDQQSAVALVHNGGTLNLFRGNLKLASDHEKLSDMGGVASVAAGGQMNIYEGCVDGSANMNSSSVVGSGGAVRVDGELNIYGGSVIGGKVTDKGGAILLRTGTAVVNIFGGTVTGGSAASGGTIYVADGTLNVTGGTVNNGTVAVNSTDLAVGNGATVYMAGGEVNLTGGTLKATTTDSIGTRGGIVYVAGGQLNIGGAAIHGATATRAGSIWVDAGTVTMTSGTVDGGKSTSGSGHGGSIYVAPGATFKLQGGTVKNGVSTKNGGNFAVHGTLEISGGRIEGGVGNATNAEHNSANIYLQATSAYKNPVLRISGGSIDGCIGIVTQTSTAADKPTVEISGAPQISNKGNGLNMGRTGSNTSSPIYIVGALFDANGNKASVPVNLGNGQNTGVFALPGENMTLTYEDKQCFSHYNNGYAVAFTANGLELVSKDALATCACATTDGNHADWCVQLDPIAWSGTNLPTAGAYYLTKPVAVTAATAVTGKLNLWLQGNDVTVSDAYVADATLKSEYVFHVAEKGALALLDTKAAAGTVYARKNTLQIVRCAGTLMLDGANLNASAITGSTSNGLAVYVGETNYPSSLFLLKKGTVTGGTTTGWGGAVYVVHHAAMKMSGGSVTGGTAKYGGNIGARGTLEITGGTVTNGRYTGGSSRGGNIYCSTLDNSEGYHSSVSITGKGLVSGGYTNASTKELTDRANICCWNANLILTDAELEGGVYLAGAGYTATMSGTVKINGDKGMTVSSVESGKTIASIKADALTAGSSVNIVVHTWAKTVGNVYVTGLAKALAEDTANPVFTCVTSGYTLNPVLEDNGETYQLVLAK